MTVESSTFTKNAAVDTATAVGGEGGGMHSNSGGEVVVTGGSFVENRALSGGGLGNEGGGVVTITGTRFAENHADEAGGGILIQSGDVQMIDVDVVGNRSESPLEGGGGISYAGDKVLGDGETASIESSRIRDNRAKGQGGGIDSRGDGPLVISQTSVSGNTAAIGGGVHHVGDAPLELRADDRLRQPGGERRRRSSPTATARPRSGTPPSPAIARRSSEAACSSPPASCSGAAPWRRTPRPRAAGSTTAAAI